MATNTMVLSIVSAEGELFSGDIASLVAPGSSGDLGIYPGHTALLTPLKPGQLEATDSKGEKMFFYISGGMLEVQPKVVTVLADTAQRAQDLDEAAAERAKEQAESLLQDKNSEIDYAKATVELAEAVAQLRAIRALRDRRK